MQIGWKPFNQMVSSILMCVRAYVCLFCHVEIALHAVTKGEAMIR